MDSIIGEIDPAVFILKPTLGIRFDLRHMQIRWALSAIIADFYAEYLVTGSDAERKRLFDEERHTVSYVLNELVENAVKFNAGPTIAIEASRAPTGYHFIVSNGLRASDIEKVKASFSALVQGDPGELLLKRIEENALGGGNASGIGFLTLMSDYGIKLGWRFSGDADEPGMVTLSTIARLVL
ncbi:MAG TPA: hypothetical protein VMV83_05010 [Rectinemataceae bacterium]|nr:hypothetical protein [Rectinemataceae bacterium]